MFTSFEDPVLYNLRVTVMPKTNRSINQLAHNKLDVSNTKVSCYFTADENIRVEFNAVTCVKCTAQQKKKIDIT